MGVFATLRERRLIQFLGAYLAGGFLALEGVDQLVDHGMVAEVVYTITLIFYIAGIPGTFIVSWFHGAKGAQKMPRLEKWMLSGVAMIAVAMSGFVVNNYVTAPAGIDAAGSAGLDPRGIAVLYFNDLSDDQNLAYLADGLTEGLIDNLSQVKALDVISRNGVEQYRDADISRDSIARALKVGTLIEGSVEEDGDDLRVTVRLIDGVSGAEFQRQTLRLPAEDLLAIRDSLAQDVSLSLREWLGEEIRLRKRREETDNVAAWALVQRAEKSRKDAMALLDEGDFDSAFHAFQKADSLLAEAEVQDTAWAEPIALRARVAYRWSRQFDYEPFEADEWTKLAVSHAHRALELDPQHAEALEIRGTTRYLRWLLNLDPDPAEAEQLLADAEQDLRAAVNIDPGRASAWGTLSHLTYVIGDVVGAKLAARRAYEEDAYLAAAEAVVRYLFEYSYDLEQFQDAVRWCDVGKGRFPENSYFVKCQLWLMTTKAKDPDESEAWRLYGELEELTPESLWDFEGRHGQMLVAAALARAGEADSARHVLERSRGNREIDPGGELVALEAFVRVLLGDYEESARLLEDFYSAHPEHEDEEWHTHWWWREAKSHPSFQELLGTVR